MYRKERKFSIPFSQYVGYSVDDYLNLVENYKDNIDSIFFGPSSNLGDHIMPKNVLFAGRPDLSSMQIIEELGNCDQRYGEFLQKTKGKYKRYLTLNNAVFGMSELTFMHMLVNQIFPIIQMFEIEGLILSNYNMACFVHKEFPELTLHNSCNSFTYSIAEMENWRVNAGVEVFNPPRQIIRELDDLKLFKDYGFKIKALVNEACYFGCTEMINHCVMRNFDYPFSYNCLKNLPVNIFKGCYIKTDWYEQLDDLVDIYKITGKTMSLERLKKTLDYYINCQDMDNMLDVIFGPATAQFLKFFPNVKISSDSLSDKLLYCQCRDCFRDCQVCNNSLIQCLQSK